MARFGQAMKDRVLGRLLPPESAAIEEVSREVGISVTTLERWRAEALSRPARERAWTAAARLQAVIATAAMNEAQCSAWCREHGLYPSELARWRDEATQALADPGEARARPAETRADRQRGLSVSHNKIGDLLTAQGDLAGASAAFRASLAIRERLAASDPGNAGWRRDLSVSHVQIGYLLTAQGDLAGAGAACRASLRSPSAWRRPTRGTPSGRKTLE